MKKSEFEILFQDLIGKRIARVRYYEIDYQDVENMWQHDERFDSLDFGLDILTGDNCLLSITWGKEFTQYGISPNSDNLPKSKGYRCIDVSKSSRWLDFVDTEITEVEIVWVKDNFLYPQNLILSFDNNRSVYISALEIWEDGSCFDMMDNITVFFDHEIAKNFGVIINNEVYQKQDVVNSLLYWGVVFSILWLAGIGSLIAIILGVKANKIIRESNGDILGSGRVWWCLIAGGLGMLFWIPVVIIGVINLL
jgi:hypothetical protein